MLTRYRHLVFLSVPQRRRAAGGYRNCSGRGVSGVRADALFGLWPWHRAASGLRDLLSRRSGPRGGGGGPPAQQSVQGRAGREIGALAHDPAFRRSEEHTSELQSLMRISYAVFCLKKKNNKVTQ